MQSTTADSDVVYVAAMGPLWGPGGDRGRRLGDLIHRDFCAATVDMDQEQVANLFIRHDLVSLPVVDEDDRLVGRVTVDDAMDVLEEEAEARGRRDRRPTAGSTARRSR